MRKIIIAVVAAAVALLGLAPSASADHAADWSANADSTIVSETAVTLAGPNTSVETGDLGINVDTGDVVSFSYELHDGAICGAGAPRVFIEINGTFYNTFDGNPEQCSNPVTFSVPESGLIAQAGVVFDQSGGYVEGSSVTVSNLTIDGQVVHFMNAPEPVDEPTDEPTDDPTEPVDEPTNEPTDEPTEPAPVIPTAVPAGSGTLPDTGPAELLGMTAAGLALLGVGGLILRRRATSAR